VRASAYKEPYIARTSISNYLRYTDKYMYSCQHAHHCCHSRQSCESSSFTVNSRSVRRSVHSTALGKQSDAPVLELLLCTSKLNNYTP